MEKNFEEILRVHLMNGQGSFYRSDICPVICAQNGATVGEFKKYCTQLKRDGILFLEKDDKGHFYYFEPVN